MNILWDRHRTGEETTVIGKKETRKTGKKVRKRYIKDQQLPLSDKKKQSRDRLFAKNGYLSVVRVTAMQPEGLRAAEALGGLRLLAGRKQTNNGLPRIRT